jgi:hypothetical protein
MFFPKLTAHRKRTIMRVVSAYNIYSEWGKIKHGVPQGSISGPLLFTLYINDLPQVINENSKIVLFADDTSVIISNTSPLDYVNKVNEDLKCLRDWFNTNLLSLNNNKTNLMHFTTKIIVIYLNITCANEIINNISNLKFLGLEINSTLSWKNHVDMIVPKLSKACHAIRIMKPFVSLVILRMIYYAYFHSIMNYGIFLLQFLR